MNEDNRRRRSSQSSPSAPNARSLPERQPRPETADDPSASPWRGPDVLDPWFQDLVARGVPSGKARQEITGLLQGGELRLSVRVAGGVRARHPYELRTKEEEKQQQEEYRVAVAKHDFEAVADAIYGTSPPGGLIGPLSPGCPGHKVDLVVSPERRLFIELLDSPFFPEHYSFAIVNPEVLAKLRDRLVGRLAGEDEGPPAGATDPQKIAWAYRRVRATHPKKLRLKGDLKRRAVYAEIDPQFNASRSSWTKAMRLVRSSDANTGASELASR